VSRSEDKGKEGKYVCAGQLHPQSCKPFCCLCSVISVALSRDKSLLPRSQHDLLAPAALTLFIHSCHERRRCKRHSKRVAAQEVGRALPALAAATCAVQRRHAILATSADFRKMPHYTRCVRCCGAWHAHGTCPCVERWPTSAAQMRLRSRV
jgi:hypothetical protein